MFFLTSRISLRVLLSNGCLYQDRGPRRTGENIRVVVWRVEGGFPVVTNFNALNLFSAASQISIAFVLLNGYFVVISISDES